MGKKWGGGDAVFSSLDKKQSSLKGKRLILEKQSLSFYGKLLLGRGHNGNGKKISQNKYRFFSMHYHACI